LFGHEELMEAGEGGGEGGPLVVVRCGEGLGDGLVGP
jgi:hypothetical protein